MWLELLADLRRYPPSWNAHLHKAVCLWTSATGWMLYQWLEVVNRCRNRSQKMPEIRKQQFRTGGVSTAMFRLSADLLAPEKSYPMFSMTEAVKTSQKCLWHEVFPYVSSPLLIALNIFDYIWQNNISCNLPLPTLPEGLYYVHE